MASLQNRHSNELMPRIGVRICVGVLRLTLGRCATVLLGLDRFVELRKLVEAGAGRIGLRTKPFASSSRPSISAKRADWLSIAAL